MAYTSSARTPTAAPSHTLRGSTFFDRDPGRQLIVLSPGETVSASLAFISGATEHAVQASYLVVTPPNAYNHLVIGPFSRANNAGITHWGSVAQTSVEDFDRLVAVGARAPFLMMQAAADTLADGGREVNISSGVTSTALAGIALYSGAKAFLDQVTKVAAVEFAARRITVNAVGPGSTVSGPFGHMTSEQKAEANSAFGLGRVGEPADTAAVVAFLASEDAGFVTGQVIYSSGGQRGPVRLGRKADETGLRGVQSAGAG
jgi:hypothetical protein